MVKRVRKVNKKVIGRSDCIVPKTVKNKTVSPCDYFVSCQECLDDRVNVGSDPKITFTHK